MSDTEWGRRRGHPTAGGGTAGGGTAVAHRQVCVLLDDDYDDYDDFDNDFDDGYDDAKWPWRRGGMV
ncbi:hypothetical protein AB0I77_28860 [Streptomyces sp. NPDC050619]|uniref:hypothetical protein n=1 Tax=Streptomyces sp. NPDC050619 TaxID=3157214 RepID=UPI0034407FE8